MSTTTDIGNSNTVKASKNMPIQPQAGAVIYARDIIRVSRFYREILGFVEKYYGQDHILLEIPGFQLVVHSIPPVIAETIEITDPPQVREDSAVKLVFYIPSIHAIRQAFINLGGALNPPEMEWQLAGENVCDGYDPEGNMIQVREISG
jgi:catechol 2,3-dioxygenase-like lactoylglutathione lyase family enzyme